MTLRDLVFLAIVTVTLTGAFLAVWLKNVFYNALALMLCLFGVAGLFIYLNSEFLAVMEVIIYIGAISVAIIFAIMLSQPMYTRHEVRNRGKLVRAAVVAVLLFYTLFRVLSRAAWSLAGTPGDYSLRAIGKNLLTVGALPFEAVSLILLVAIIGALVISDKRRA